MREGDGVVVWIWEAVDIVGYEHVAVEDQFRGVEGDYGEGHVVDLDVSEGDGDGVVGGKSLALLFEG